MNPNILSLVRLPARLTVDETATVLGFTPFEISILVGQRQLKPLGDPPANGHKFFAASIILENAADPSWLDKASRTVTKHWQTKNQRRRRLLNAV